MSLLADLLKTRDVKPSGSKDVIPTLLRAQGVGSTSLRLKRRYIILSVIALSTIFIGLFLPSQLKRLSYFRPAKTATVPPPPPLLMPLPPRTAPAREPGQIVEEAKKAVAGGAPHKTAVPEKTVAVTNPDKSVAAAVVSKKPTSAATGVKKTARLMARTLPRKQNRVARIQGRTDTTKPVKVTNKRVETAPGKIDTDARGALLYAARSSEQSGDWRSALASYRAALDIDPDNYRIMSNSAAAYNKLGMYPDGEREARMALARKPDYVPALINAAIACSSQGNSKVALKLFAAAAAAEPGNKSLAINLGVMQERTGNMDEALATYRRAAASDDPQAMLGVARIYDQRGNKNEAIKAYRLIMLQKDASPSLKQEAKKRLLRLEE